MQAVRHIKILCANTTAPQSSTEPRTSRTNLQEELAMKPAETTLSLPFHTPNNFGSLAPTTLARVSISLLRRPSTAWSRTLFA